MTSYHYAIYDVFTGTRLEGNPLAVVFGADGLSDARMAMLAREFNLSETVFVLGSDNPGHTARLRIFTPAREMPFAGHPTVGTAVALGERMVEKGEVAADADLVMMLDEVIGPVRCATRLVSGEPGFAEFDLPRLSRRLQAPLTSAEVGEALGLSAHEIGFENHVVSLWSAGVPFVLVPVHDLSVAARVECNAALWQNIAPMGDGQLAHAYVYCRGGVHHDAAFHARMFASEEGTVEDPATGSAVAAMSGAIHHFDGVRDGHLALMIEQGVEMGRPSHIHLHLDCAGGKISKARIGGQAVRIASGRLTL
ncbi:trans-2,3-dihydro-3-hydroxyanthranilate isomerase [Hoeflea marina]|uniref:Trans-2,3-dihydro-3-hydroxyanthranilate isomerase n=1 Tax=Hoeflea marina TaxID=274592 RepID=A0A317PKG5_9HYPH|nr:PhzF family phenazine biosynthesis protein [Hoeflea marina]PWV99079.1 trans-2,3-dihydro-3-hydroxyanthranilate isomerase [Hoeflea marina]